MKYDANMNILDDDAWFTSLRDEYLKALNDSFFAKYPDLLKFINFQIGGNQDEKKITGVYAGLKHENSIYKGSKYFYPGSDNIIELVHFTSIESVLGIIHSQNLRLKSLNNVNDPNEINYCAEVFGLEKEDIENNKKGTLSVSFCDYKNELQEIGDNTNNLDLWRFYGHDGRGVCIKFTLENDQEKWNTFQLSRIKYGVDEIKKYKEMAEDVNIFNETHPNLYINLVKFFAFHKSNIFKNENEVRLLLTAYYKKETDSLLLFRESGIQDEIYPKSEKNENSFFVYLPLLNCKNTEAQSYFFESAPKIIIDEIILGYRFKDSELSMYKDIFNKILKEKAGYELDNGKIYISDLKTKFR